MALEFPNIDPVALEIGPVVIRWYALSYMAGFLLGWQYCMKLARLDGGVRPSPEDMDDFLPWAILGVILGGRLGYVLFYQFGYYLDNPLAALQVWNGGMSFHGGALGVILAMIIYAAVKKISFFRFSDIVVCAVPIGLFFGRIANFVNGELFGRASDVPWAMVFPMGGDEARHPSQLYEAVLEGAVLFLILGVLIRIEVVRSRPGILGGAFLAGYGFFRGLIEFFREPDAHLGLIGEALSMGQVLSLPMIIFGLGLCVWAYRRGPISS